VASLIYFSGVFEVVFCGRRVHFHAANRILHGGRRIGNIILHAPRGILANSQPDEASGATWFAPAP
jgi:hypothetical protein